MERKVGQLGEELSEIATLAADVGKDHLHRLRDAATQNYQHAKEQLVTWEEGLESYIRSRPIKSLLLAAAVGACFALFMRRR
jgi:ElaB/YqjD/DUF883 family membrane-anchored ribosome-binding protein